MEIKKLLLVVCLLLCHYAGYAADVKINEIFYNPVSSPEHYYEWVEIYNAGAADVVVSSWSFVVGTSTYTFKPFNKADALLPVESYAVLVTSASCFLGNHTGFDALLLEFNKTVRLSNSGKYIALIDDNNAIVDSLFYSPQWNNNKEDKSIERNSAFADSSDPSIWQESADMGGTPGRTNSLGVVIPDDEQEDDASEDDSPEKDGSDETADETAEETAEETVESEGDIQLTAGSFSAVITEVAPSESGGKDWIEIFVLEQTDISLFSLYERETEIKKFSSLSVEAGTYLVVQLDENLSDETEDTNNNGYLDFFCSDSV